MWIHVGTASTKAAAEAFLNHYTCEEDMVLRYAKASSQEEAKRIIYADFQLT